MVGGLPMGREAAAVEGGGGAPGLQVLEHGDVLAVELPPHIEDAFAAVAILLVALLGTADISTLLLLHPPGEGSLPLAIFTVMANAPEALVASLCLIYVGGASALLASVWSMAGRRKA